MSHILPPWIVLDPLLQQWLLEDIGRGDRSTDSLFTQQLEMGTAEWIIKETGIVAGLPIAARVFQLLDPLVKWISVVPDGTHCQKGEVIARVKGPMNALLTGERVALNLVMRLSGIASKTHEYAKAIAELPTQLVDTRKTTPGLRLLEKYATQVGGGQNHRMGLDDAVMIKDNHIAAAGGIAKAIAKVRATIPYPLMIEVETETLEQVQMALEQNADIIMLDNMAVEQMKQAVPLIRQHNPRIKIEASGNITLETIRAVAETGVDYISTSAPITRSTWLDISMRMS